MRAVGITDSIVNFYEIHETENSVYMVLEYLGGGELLRRMSSKKKYGEQFIRKLMLKILSGLFHCHKLGIMHRDLKPENLMLIDKKKIFSVKIIDFGLATFIDVDKYLFGRCGTPGYVAPEIILQKN